MKKLLFGMLLVFALETAVLAAPRPVETQDVVLKRGWNLITLMKPIEESEPLRNLLKMNLVTLDSHRRHYTRCASAQELKVGTGYWVYCNEDSKSFSLTVDITKTDWEPTDAETGANLLGVTSKSDWMDNATSIQEWSNNKWITVKPEDVKQGQVYWVRIDRE